MIDAKAILAIGFGVVGSVIAVAATAKAKGDAVKVTGIDLYV